LDEKHKPQEFNFSSTTDIERKNYTEKYLEHGYATHAPTDMTSVGFIGQILMFGNN